MIDGSLLPLWFQEANSYFRPDQIEFSVGVDTGLEFTLEIQTQIEQELSINRQVDDELEINRQLEFTVER
jgi:hypothetical protein